MSAAQRAPRVATCYYRGPRRATCEKCGQLDSEHSFWEEEVFTLNGMRHDDKLARVRAQKRKIERFIAIGLMLR